MEITSVDAKTGEIVGTYKTGVGAPKPTDAFPLTGFVNGDLIAFSVNWGEISESLTAWAGQHTNAGANERIRTMWNLARNIGDADEAKKLWGGVLAGADSFMRGPVPTGCIAEP